MTDFILKIRLGIIDTPKNKKWVPIFSKWLNQEYPKPSYNEQAVEFVQNIMKSAQTPFENMSMEITHSAKNDYLEDLRHPRLEAGGKWFLDDSPLKNKSIISIKLENQWLKGKVEIKDKNTYIVFEPENIAIPMNENLFLRR